jgi:hypothetical protein
MHLALSWGPGEAGRLGGGPQHAAEIGVAIAHRAAVRGRRGDDDDCPHRGQKQADRWAVERYLALGAAGRRRDATRPGHKPPLSAAAIARVVHKTLQEKPPAATHWSLRRMARAVGLSRSRVQRIWKAHGLKPHLTRTFKLSNDKPFVEKVKDVVGLYLDPPDKALVFSVDEKSQLQALDRTQPGLPLKKGRAGTMTHDYKRHGTTTLFAALNVATGEVIGQCMQRHRHQEWLRFLRTIDRNTPKNSRSASDRRQLVHRFRETVRLCRIELTR